MNKVFSFTASLVLITNVAAGGDDRDIGPVESLQSHNGSNNITEKTVFNNQDESDMTMLSNVYYPEKLNERVISSKSFVDKFDLNKDDKVTVDEIIKHSNKRFTEINKDKVGDITKEDLNSSLKNGLTEDFTEVFFKLDENKDGLITSAEGFNTTNTLINNDGDTNNDGRVSLAEYKTFSVKAAIENAIEEIDVNNDQNISKEELLAKMTEAMDGFDTNNNKVVNSAD